MRLNNLWLRQGSVCGWRASPWTSGASCTPGRKAEAVHLLHRPPGRRAAHVLRVHASEPRGGMDAHAVRDHQFEAIMYIDEVFDTRRGGQPAVQAAFADLDEQARAFGLGVTLVTQNPVDLDSQGTVEHRHLVHRAPADRSRQDAHPGRARGPSAGSGKRSDRAQMHQLIAG